MEKGEAREKALDKDVYYSDSYFSILQLYSLSQQLHEIYKLKPNSILEIGIGNGFTSSFLKRAGYEVYTVDINPNLKPDLVSSIDGMPENLPNKQFDLVVCCEVLEHMPFEQFESAIEIFRSYSDQLLLTLPSYQAWIGFSGFLRIPKIGYKQLSLGFNVSRPKKLEDNMHFWELGSHVYSNRRNVIALLSKYYSSVEHGVFIAPRHHEYFICK